MHNKSFRLVFALFISCFAPLIAYAQQPNNQTDSKDKWIRVQSDNGEFSIEVPEKYKFYRNKDGFIITENAKDYRLANMRMLNTYNAGTLLSFETYETKKDALERIYGDDVYKKNDIEKSVIKRGDHSIRQVTTKTDKYYSIRQYFNSKTNIYVLTAISRRETPQMRRFLDSLVFKPNTKDDTDASAVLLSALPIDEIAVEEKLENDASPFPSAPPNLQKDDNIIPVVIVSRPRASYVTPARQKWVKGTIRLKPTLSADGFVTNIVVVKTLPEGLLRQALFAAIRLKFLPKENRGIPETVVVTVEYTFDIY